MCYTKSETYQCFISVAHLKIHLSSTAITNEYIKIMHFICFQCRNNFYQICLYFEVTQSSKLIELFLENKTFTKSRIQYFFINLIELWSFTGDVFQIFLKRKLKKTRTVVLQFAKISMFFSAIFMLSICLMQVICMFTSPEHSAHVSLKFKDPWLFGARPSVFHNSFKRHLL